jgi:hypothetical protein
MSQGARAKTRNPAAMLSMTLSFGVVSLFTGLFYHKQAGNANKGAIQQRISAHGNQLDKLRYPV